MLAWLSRVFLVAGYLDALRILFESLHASFSVLTSFRLIGVTEEPPVQLITCKKTRTCTTVVKVRHRPREEFRSNLVHRVRTLGQTNSEVPTEPAYIVPRQSQETES